MWFWPGNREFLKGTRDHLHCGGLERISKRYCVYDFRVRDGKRLSNFSIEGPLLDEHNIGEQTGNWYSGGLAPWVISQSTALSGPVVTRCTSL